MGYVDIATFKTYVGSARGANTADEALLQSALDAAHAGINEALQRELVVASAASDRLYVPSNDYVLRIHDCTTITSITAGTAVLAAGGWQAEPLRPSWSGLVRPYEQVRRLWSVWYRTAWYGQATITVNATWGWAAIPVEAVEAVKILAKDIASNRDVSFGIAGFTQYAGIRARENPQVWNLIGGLRRMEAVGIA
jgi:hypothetical protein